MESATPCHDTQVEGLYWVLNAVYLTVLAAKSEDYSTMPITLSKTFQTTGTNFTNIIKIYLYIYSGKNGALLKYFHSASSQ